MERTGATSSYVGVSIRQYRRQSRKVGQHDQDQECTPFSNEPAAMSRKSAPRAMGNGEAAPIYGITLPSGYRDWTLISVGHIGGSVNDLRVKLGNDIAIKAYREGNLPFPDGAVIARLAWRQVASEEINKALRPALERTMAKKDVNHFLAESGVAGPATDVEFMVEDSKKYASTGGWGFAEFNRRHVAVSLRIVAVIMKTSRPIRPPHWETTKMPPHSTRTCSTLGRRPGDIRRTKGGSDGNDSDQKHGR